MKQHSPLLPLHLSAIDLRHVVASLATRYWAAHLDTRATQARQHTVWCGNTVDWQDAVSRATSSRIGKAPVSRARSTRLRANRSSR